MESKPDTNPISPDELFMRYCTELTNVFEKQANPNDSQHQLDVLTLYGFLADAPESKDAALHMLGVFGRYKSAIADVYQKKLIEVGLIVMRLTSAIQEKVIFSLDKDEQRADAFVSLFKEHIEKLDIAGVDQEIIRLALSAEPLRRQHEITADFYQNTEALVHQGM